MMTRIGLVGWGHHASVVRWGHHASVVRSTGTVGGLVTRRKERQGKEGKKGKERKEGNSAKVHKVAVAGVLVPATLVVA